VAKVLSHLDDIDFDISNTESDVLGDAYEYLIGEFASGAGKKAEFYTPQTVSTLLAKIVTQGKLVYVLFMTRLVVQVRCCYVLNVKSRCRYDLRSGDEPYHLQLGTYEHDFA
jgi:hypothetical protein